MVSKSFKTAKITLALDGSEDEMFIGHNLFLDDDQVVVEKVEQPADEKKMKEWKMQKLMIINRSEDEKEIEGVGVNLLIKN